MKETSRELREPKVEPQQRVGRIKFESEAATQNFGISENSSDVKIESARQFGVGMEEQKHVREKAARSVIELHSPVLRRYGLGMKKLVCNPRGIVRRSAIHDDNRIVAPANLVKSRQKILERLASFSTGTTMPMDKSVWVFGQLLN